MEKGGLLYRTSGSDEYQNTIFVRAAINKLLQSPESDFATV